MISRYEVTLNGVNMEGLNSSILITDVNYEEPNYVYESLPIAKRNGAKVYRKYKEKAAVSVNFQIRAYDITERQSICQSIIGWAKDGGDLRINDRPGQKLICVCEKYPAVTSVRGWTEDLTISFAAYLLPYWQEVNPTVYTDENGGAARTFEIFVPGNAPYAYASLEYEATGGGMNWFRFGLADETGVATFDQTGKYIDVDFQNYEEDVGYIGSGDILRLQYDDDLIQTIKYYQPSGSTYITRNLIGYRSGIDDVKVECGTTVKLAFQGQRYTNGGEDVESSTGNLTVTVRGLWE